MNKNVAAAKGNVLWRSMGDVNRGGYSRVRSGEVIFLSRLYIGYLLGSE